MIPTSWEALRNMDDTTSIQPERPKAQYTSNGQKNEMGVSVKMRSANRWDRTIKNPNLKFISGRNDQILLV
jgi:hypothetical protein